jgi:hypothetical protein
MGRGLVFALVALLGLVLVCQTEAVSLSHLRRVVLAAKSEETALARGLAEVAEGADLEAEAEAEAEAEVEAEEEGDDDEEEDEKPPEPKCPVKGSNVDAEQSTPYVYPRLCVGAFEALRLCEKMGWWV